MSSTYYVSVTGSDQNDGLSPEQPIQSFDKIEAVAKPGDRVLFKRGDVFRLVKVFNCVDGVTYDAYGEGNKPRIYGSRYNYAQAEMWEQTEEDDLWKCTMDFDGGDVCHIVFDDGAAWSVRCRSLAAVQNDLDYYYHYDLQAVFLRCNGHPAQRFSYIEMGRTNLFLLPCDAQNIVIRNLEFRHGNYAIYNHCDRLHDLRNLCVEYCDFAWLGGHEGHYGPGEVRDGNAICFWGNARQVFIDHCNFYQLFDTAFTPQCAAGPNSEAAFEDITMSNCRIEKCHWSTEYWIHVKDDNGNQIGVMRNICYENNHFIDAGEGWAACQRWNGGPPSSSSHIQTFDEDECGLIENIVVRNNIFERGSHDLISFYWKKAMPILEGNTYIQVKGRPLGHIGGELYIFDDKAEETIRQFDKTAKVAFAE